LAKTLGISQGDKNRADKLMRRLGLGMKFKGWRMSGLPEDPTTSKVPWQHNAVESFVFRKQ
jgi:hypothetical protein